MNLSKRETVLVSILVGVAIIGVYVFYLFLPKYHGYIGNRQKLQQNKQVLEVLQELETSGQLEKKEQETKAKWIKADEAIPSNMKMPTLYSELLKMRDASNVKYQSLEFATADQSTDQVVEENNSIAKVDINIVLNGTYEEIDSYLKSLYGSQRKLVITKISYKTVEDRLEVSLLANAFAQVKEGADQSEQFEFIEGETYGKVNPYK